MGNQARAMQEHSAADQLRSRLAVAPSGRLLEAAEVILRHIYAVLEELRPSPGEFDALVQFLTDVGYATHARRQEWVLLADILGLSATVADRPAMPGATPVSFAGPFYRSDAPWVEQGGSLSRDGRGAMAVSGLVNDCDGLPVAGADVEVWHANGQGRYENQDPDNQPDYNLRGRLTTDAKGRFAFTTERPGGYSLPGDGPVGLMASRLGLSLVRPAHIHFAVSAPGYHRLVTAIFDGGDPAIGRDPLFAVKPQLVAEFPKPGAALKVALVLAPLSAPHIT